MGSLTILVGIPGCGKSTWADKLAPLSPKVSSDTIRESMGDVSDQTRNSEVFERFHSDIGWLLERDFDVVADSTALDQRARATLHSLARQYGAPVHLVYFSNCDQAVRRNARRERVVPESVMQRMLDKYEYFKVVLPTEAHLYDTVTEIRSFE